MSRKNLSRTVIEGGRYHRNQFDRNHSHRVELAWANGRLAANTFMGWWWFRIVSAHLFDDHADRSNNHLVGGHTVRYVTECALTKGDLRRLARVVDVDLRSQVLLRRPSKI